jgi:hypothetical protein
MSNNEFKYTYLSKMYGSQSDTFPRFYSNSSADKNPHGEVFQHPQHLIAAVSVDSERKDDVEEHTRKCMTRKYMTRKYMKWSKAVTDNNNCVNPYIRTFPTSAQPPTPIPNLRTMSVREIRELEDDAKVKIRDLQSGIWQILRKHKDLWSFEFSNDEVYLFYGPKKLIMISNCKKFAKQLRTGNYSFLSK